MSPLFRRQQHAVVAAVALTAAAGLCWWDAYERRGNRRPFWTRVAGVVI
ncbi:hypothetical protein ACFV0D_12640 [Streptomyces sp. NPDC059556]